MPGWTIRTATLDDIDAVLELWREAAVHAATGSNRDGLRRLLASDRDALLLAELSALASTPASTSAPKPAGSLIAAWDGWRGNFYRLAVHPAHRRAGLATALVREGERRLRARGAERLTAIVAPEEDPGAHEFWTAAGYERQSARERFVRELLA